MSIMDCRKPTTFVTIPAKDGRAEKLVFALPGETTFFDRMEMSQHCILSFKGLQRDVPFLYKSEDCTPVVQGAMYVKWC